MGNSDTEMDVGDGPEEDPEYDDADTPSPGDDHNHGSPGENGNDIAHSPKQAGPLKTGESGGGFDRKAQNGAEPANPRLSGRILSRSTLDGNAVRSSKRQKNVEYDEEAGSKEEQAEFLRQLEVFYKERYMDFKLPKFYGEPLNLLKLWRSVLQLGGYDRVTLYKLWRQVGESFHPPKTCTTVSWTFRIFYEKSLLEFERHKKEIGELVFPDSPEPPPENDGGAHTSLGRVRRESATRAMQGWHAQREFGLGDIAEPIVKDKNLNSGLKREKHLKNIGVKQKKTSNLELAEHDMNAEANRLLVATIVDLGPPADWVKISVRESKDSFEVYALVPGLLREEVRVQSDPSGRVVITGQPEQLDNPWGITPFKKVVNLPARIDPLHTSAVVSLHGRLFVRVPFE